MKKFLTIVAFAGLATAANAQVWVEIPDAGEMAAQAAVGAGVLSSISGATNDTSEATGVDMYAIQVSSWANFSATTAGSSFDTQLFLFDSAGMGIACNDDAVGVQSTLPVGHALYAGRTDGEIIMIAISGYNRDPNSAGGLMFPNTFSGVWGPTGPGGTSVLSNWTGTAARGVYEIRLTGTSFVPAPGAAALLGLGGLVAGRRRR